MKTREFRKSRSRTRCVKLTPERRSQMCADRLGVSEASFCIWKEKYAHLGVGELWHVRQLEEQDSRLKQVVADLTLNKHILQEILRRGR